MRKIGSRECLFILLLIGFFLLFITNCRGRGTKEDSGAFDLGDPEKKNNIILSVEDTFYFNSDFEKYVSATYGDDPEDLTVVSLSRLFDNFVEEKIFLQAVKEKNINLTWEEKEEYLAKLSSELRSAGSGISVEEMNTEILFDRLLIEKYTYELVKDIEVEEEEIKEYYNLHKREFLRPERIRVSQILLKTENKAIEVLERVKNSTEEGFRRVAMEESVGLEVDKGGEMGVFEMGQLPYEMERVIFPLEEGEISSVMASAYGFHIFRLDKKYKPVLISEKDAFSEIKVKILNQKIKQRISEHLDELEENMEWSFYSQNLTFPYQRNNT